MRRKAGGLARDRSRTMTATCEVQKEGEEAFASVGVIMAVGVKAVVFDLLFVTWERVGTGCYPGL